MKKRGRLMIKGGSSSKLKKRKRNGSSTKGKSRKG